MPRKIKNNIKIDNCITCGKDIAKYDNYSVIFNGLQCQECKENIFGRDIEE